MKLVYKKMFGMAKPYLKTRLKKDLVLHTKNVLWAVEYLLKHEKGNENMLIPAAILHDVGWFKVPEKLQQSKDKKDSKKALVLHIQYSKKIIYEILTKLNYDKKDIKKIFEIVESHKFKNPRNINKRLLIDADNLSDVFKEQFYSDSKYYNCSLKENYEYRIKNTYYTDSARKLALEEMEKRRKEISLKL